MNSSTHSSYSQLLQAPEADHNASERLNAEPEKPPDAKLFYLAVSLTSSAILLASVIAGNCLCSGYICLCLWRFSQIDIFASDQVFIFNTCTLLLSAALGLWDGGESWTTTASWDKRIQRPMWCSTGSGWAIVAQRSISLVED